MLGKFERVEIKTVWSKELEFSSWLGGDDGLELLGEAMGIEELMLEGLEVSVGSYVADVVCMDVDDANLVVIENQFKKSDHDHLGKLLTYASGLAKTKAVVWIAEEIGDEHRAALDWLNERTNDRIGFFGFEIELLKIGNSNPAPQLHPVAWPNEWVRDVAATRQRTETELLYLEYWTKLKEHMEKINADAKIGKPQAQGWMTFPIGKSFCHIETIASATNKSMRTELRIRGYTGVDGYLMADYIKGRHSEKILSALGPDVVYPDPKNKAAGTKGTTARIYIQKENVNVRDKNDWSGQHQWFSNTIDKFIDVFSPIVAEINPNDFRHDEGENAEDDDNGEHDSL